MLKGQLLVQDFSDLEQDLEETTAEDSRQGKDMQVIPSTCAYSVHANNFWCIGDTRILLLQGIPWDRMQFSREHYRVGLESRFAAQSQTYLLLTHNSILSGVSAGHSARRL